ncbi:hypothetical protein PYCH_07960 [Pyrococcus yayanosii CH1]|uniref:Uncharacterized protein n=1 Tax=Pyrococcus yayanosii (strain CH1 / JCM 16557) TaxID=529709 RepID=F8AJ00_PYRYC|nr:hypothetical protein PYCH_07960 [Pyrococcus yayanosii CH1]
MSLIGTGFPAGSGPEPPKLSILFESYWNATKRALPAVRTSDFQFSLSLIGTEVEIIDIYEDDAFNSL